MSRIPTCARIGKALFNRSVYLNRSLPLRVPQTQVKYLWSKAENKKDDSEKKDASGSTSSEENKSNNSEVNAEIEDLNKQIEALTEKNNDLLDKYKRALADGENARQRFNKQLEESKLYGIQSFCKDLLDIADTLSLANDSVPKEEIKESNPHLKSLYEGLIMTDSNLKKVFKRHGLETINPLGEKFDPNFHEALFEQAVEGKEPNTVVVVSKIGYKLYNRVIRPALVGISKS
uniref:GrpE protein homolog n=1 Tax=Cacopsylla melanoneura TaxID=428564 RepID=A0A8D8T2R7_9HEMI